MKDKIGFYAVFEREEIFIEVIDMGKFIEEIPKELFKQLMENIKTYTEQNRTLMNLMQQNIIKSTSPKGKNNTKQHVLLLNKIVFQNDKFLAKISKLTKSGGK